MRWNGKTLYGSIIGLCLVIFSVCAFADGETRIMTKAEKDFYDQVQTTFKKAIPPGPSGWDLINDEDSAETDRVSVGTEKGPFVVDFSFSWEDTRRIEAGQAAEEEELAKLQDDPDASIEKAMKRLKKLTPHDVSVIISLSANRFWEEFYDPVGQEPPIAGAPVYRTPGVDDPNKGWYEGTTCVLLGGNWKLTRDGRVTTLKTAPRKGVPYIQVQTIIVQVRADQTRARKILEKMDWDALKKLIKNQ